MTTGHRIILRGFTVKNGQRVVRDQRRLNVSARLKQRNSKKVRVVRKGTLK